MFDSQYNLLFNKTASLLFTLDQLPKQMPFDGYVSFGNYMNGYVSMKGIIYESRFSTYPYSSWT